MRVSLKRFFFWMFLVALILTPVVGAEIILRHAGLGHPILFYTNASYRFAPQPNQKQLRRQGAWVTIDSKGLRSVRDWTAPADAKILFVGDSVTWAGTYIDDNDTFAQGVCARLEKSTGKLFTCGNAGANQYGTDNMAERIRYKDFDDETVLVVTLISGDVLRGLADAEGRFFFVREPPGLFKALWEATTFAVWRVYMVLRPLGGSSHQTQDDLRVADRSLQNLFSAIRETDHAGRRVLIVFSPVKWELHEQESELTRHVRTVLANSGFDVLDLTSDVAAALTDDFYSDLIHLEARAHRFYADQITRRLAPYFLRRDTGSSAVAPP